ncbi:MAG: class I SAM-dependent methyltransferase [Anaerolineae bacterium]|nr:class I SAM-dependent methyltransferase [Anaerolineae bacterium]
MNDRDAGGIAAQSTNTSDPYYRSGTYLRQKHQLAGTRYVQWVLDLIPDWTAATILDAGGGWGRYLWQLLDHERVDGQNMILTDLSEGMLHTAFEEAARRTISLKVSRCNLEALPFASRQFDIVMANKVLYHLQDIPRGVEELARVVNRSGVVMATTNSEKITATIIALHYQALETLGVPFTPEAPSPFSMENGGELLAARFRQVARHYYEAETLIRDAGEVRALYETIGRYRNLLPRDDISTEAKQALPVVVEKLAQNVIDREGVLRSPELMGAFVCSDPV